MANTKSLTASYALDASGIAKGVAQANSHLGGLTAAMQGVENAGKGSFGRLGAAMAGAFGGALEPIMGTFETIKGGISDTAAKLDELSKAGASTGQKVGAGMAGIGATGVAVAGAALLMSSGFKQSGDQLKQAISDAGGNFDDFSGRIDAAQGHLKKFASGSQVNDALATLTTDMKDPDAALKALNETADIAASKHISLAAAATLVGKAYANPSRLAKMFGDQVTSSSASLTAASTATKAHEAALGSLASAQSHLSDLEAVDHGKKSLTIADQQALSKAQDAVTAAQGKVASSTTAMTAAQAAAQSPAQSYQSVMDQIAKQTGGQMTASTNNLKGTLTGLKNTIEDTASSLAQKWGPTVMAGSAGLGLLGSTVDGASKILGKFGGAGKAAAKAATDIGTAQKAGAAGADALKAAQAALIPVTETATAAEDAAAVSEGLALGPILLIVAGIALLVLAGYELVTHWKTVTKWLGEAFDKIKEAFKAAAKAVGKAIDDIIKFFKDLPGKILGAISDAATWLLNTGKSIITGLLNGITGAVTDVTKFFTGLGTTILGYVTGAATWLAKTGKDIITGVLNGIVDGAKDVWKWWQNLATTIKGYVTGATTWLYNTGKDVLTGVFNGIVDGAKQVWKWLGDLGTAVTGAITGAATWLYNTGKDILTGVFNGVVDGAKQVLKWAGDLHQAIGNAIGDATKWLYQIGKDIITGLINGIGSMFDGVKNTLGDLTHKLTSWKGPPEADAKLLHGSGQLIIGGLIGGLESKYGDVQKSLGGLMTGMGNVALPDVNASIAAGGSSRPPVLAAGGGGYGAAGGGGTVVNVGGITVNVPGGFGTDPNALAAAITPAIHRELINLGTVNGSAFPGYLG